jgi:hypothetical protein
MFRAEDLKMLTQDLSPESRVFKIIAALATLPGRARVSRALRGRRTVFFVRSFC